MKLAGYDFVATPEGKIRVRHKPADVPPEIDASFKANRGDWLRVLPRLSVPEMRARAEEALTRLRALPVYKSWPNEKRTRAENLLRAKLGDLTATIGQQHSVPEDFVADEEGEPSNRRRIPPTTGATIRGSAN